MDPGSILYGGPYSMAHVGYGHPQNVDPSGTAASTAASTAAAMVHSEGW